MIKSRKRCESRESWLSVWKWVWKPQLLHSATRVRLYTDAPSRTAQGYLVFRKMLVFTPRRTQTDEATPWLPYRFRDNIRLFAKRTATQHARLEMTHTLRSLGKCTTHCHSIV